MPFVYGIVIWCTVRIWLHLKTAFGMVSEQRSHQLNHEINRVLIVQALNPLLVILLPCTLIIIAFVWHFNMRLAGSLLTMCLSWLPVINPLTTMLIIRPYRRTLVEWVKGASSTNRNI